MSQVAYLLCPILILLPKVLIAFFEVDLESGVLSHQFVAREYGREEAAEVFVSDELIHILQ